MSQITMLHWIVIVVMVINGGVLGYRLCERHNWLNLILALTFFVLGTINGIMGTR
jgi:hypothetical protein